MSNKEKKGDVLEKRGLVLPKEEAKPTPKLPPKKG